ncbi:MAG: hypothetical protein N3E37_00620 [Candidatus Micrarchaeota archaeon]|nr:hypothetical protein [Candidatus Micrarchaeota archaeon]
MNFKSKYLNLQSNKNNIKCSACSSSLYTPQHENSLIMKHVDKNFFLKENISIVLDQVFNFNFRLTNKQRLTRTKLLSGDNLEISCDYLLRYDFNLNKIRVLGRNSRNGLVIAFILDDELKIKAIRRYDCHKFSEYEHCLDALQDLCHVGILKKDLFKMLGITEWELNYSKNLVLYEQRLLSEIEELNKVGPGISKLASILLVKDQKPFIVLQGMGVILDINNDIYDGLYTFDACPCLILIVKAFDRSGDLKKIGLAHIDSLVTEDDILLFLNRLSNYNLEFSIISGEVNRVLLVYKILKQKGYSDSIRFFDADLDGSRSDAIYLDKEGTVYYGDNYSWNMEVDLTKVVSPGLNTGLKIIEIKN